MRTGAARDDEEEGDCISGELGEELSVGRRFWVRKTEPRDLLAWVERRDLRVEKNCGDGVRGKAFSSLSLRFFLFQVWGYRYLIVCEMLM
jgi:hypothetical protein